MCEPNQDALVYVGYGGVLRSQDCSVRERSGVRHGALRELVQIEEAVEVVLLYKPLLVTLVLHL